MLNRIVVGTFLAFLGCATASQRSVTMTGRGEPAQPLYVGHSQDGEVVVAASHAAAMNGLAVAAADLGVSKDSDELLVCRREIVTGTHVPTWICRYPTEVERERMLTHQFMVQPRVCTDCRPQ